MHARHTFCQLSYRPKFPLFLWPNLLIFPPTFILIFYPTYFNCSYISGRQEKDTDSPDLKNIRQNSQDIAHTAWMKRNVSPSCVQVKGLKLQPCRQQANTLSLNPVLATFIFSCFILCTSHIPLWGWNPQEKATSPSPALSLWYLLFTLLFPLEHKLCKGRILSCSLFTPWLPGAGGESSCSRILTEWMLFNKYSWLISDACLSFWSIPSLCNGAYWHKWKNLVSFTMRQTWVWMLCYHRWWWDWGKKIKLPNPISLW